MRAMAAVVLTAGLLFGSVACSVDQKAERNEAYPACLDALDSADRLMMLAGQALQYSSEALEAAGNLDVAGINAAADRLDALNPQVEAEGDKYAELSSDCRGQNA